MTATLDFTLTAEPVNPDQLAHFSAEGPNVDGSIKPDLVAVGMHVYTAAQNSDPKGVLYDPSRYAVVDGTSFSSPLVAGSAALLKAARPGLTVAQYRSLLINNAGRISYAPGTPAMVQQAGAGNLDVSAALRSTAAMSPVSISFGIGAGTASVSRSLTISNVGTASETYQLSAVATGSAPIPALSSNSITLDPGASASVTLNFPASGLGASGIRRLPRR